LSGAIDIGILHLLYNQAPKKGSLVRNAFYGHLHMPHKWLNIFILSGEAKLHRGLYEKQYILRLILYFQGAIDINRTCRTAQAPKQAAPFEPV
jgi:hypothetical protein